MNKILVVDDEAEIRNLLKRMLARKDYEVTLCSSGEEALETLQSAVPDVILTDVQMPGISGLDLIRFVSEKFPRIPIIVITAHGNFSTAVEALNSGAFYFMIKPFGKKNLLKTVQKAIRLPRVSSERLRTIPFVEHELNITIPADYAYIDGVTYQLVSAAESMGFPLKALTMGIPIAADELIANAISHGAKEDPNRKIFVRAAIDGTRFRMTVRDEGKGFNPSQTSREFVDVGPFDFSGRGIQMVHHYMDTLTYNAKGNEATATLYNPSKKTEGPPDRSGAQNS